MAIRINDYVTAGELRNTNRNSIRGWIEFAPDYGIGIELTGNFKGQFEGKHFRFRVKKPEHERIAIEDLPDCVECLADRQIGVVGDVLLREVKVPTVPIAEFLQRSKLGEPTPCDIKDSLYLEWYSQNGRVVAEIMEPEIEFVSEDPNDHESLVAEPLFVPDNEDTGEADKKGGLSITRIEIDEDGTAITEEIEFERDNDSVDDEFQLFDEDLEQKIQRSLADLAQPVAEDLEDDADLWSGDLSGSETTKLRSWDEVIPGIDPETKALYESWDEIYGGEKDEPVSNLFDPPLQLPPMETITTDEDAEPVLKMILGRLAQFNIAFDLCEHCTPLSAYRMLVNEILPEAKVHPNLAATDIVEHYCAYAYCPQCAAEFESEYE